MARTAPRWIALVVLAVSASAAAQQTGGSFGGRSGSWGSSGGSSSWGSSSSGSGWGSSSSSSRWESGSSSGRWESGSSSRSSSSNEWRSSSSSGSSSYGGSSGGPRTDPWLEAREHRGAPEVTPAERAALTPADAPLPLSHLWGGVFVLLFALTWVPDVVSRIGKRRTAAPVVKATILRVSVGFDWTVREDLQERIDALSRTLSVETPKGRAEAARAVAALMREHLLGARYALSTVRVVNLGAAPDVLDRLSLDLRARFTHETRGRRSTSAAPELRARPEEGPGMLVVSLIVGGVFEASGGEIQDRAGLDRALREIEQLRALDGLEVIWSPAERDDRMSSYELERFYPELGKLADAGSVGSMACPHCGGARPAELRFCPHCGSPST